MISQKCPRFLLIFMNNLLVFHILTPNGFESDYCDSLPILPFPRISTVLLDVTWKNELFGSYNIQGEVVIPRSQVSGI